MSGQLVGLVLALPPEAAAGVERLVLVALAEATNASGDGWCWPSVRSVAGDVAAHPGSVRRAITELADRKVIEVEHRSGRTSRYRVIVPSDEFPYRVGARTNPAQSARGRGGHSGSETPRKVRGTPRQSARRPRARCAPNRKEPEWNRKIFVDEESKTRRSRRRRPGATARGPGAVAMIVDPVRRRALQLAREMTDNRIAAGIRIVDPDAYAARSAADFMDQAQREVLAEQRENGHKGCPTCRGRGYLPDWIGSSYIERPCPGPDVEPEVDPRGATKEQILADYPPGTSIWQVIEMIHDNLETCPYKTTCPVHHPDTYRGPGFMDDRRQPSVPPPEEHDGGDEGDRPCFVCDTVHPDGTPCAPPPETP